MTLFYTFLFFIFGTIIGSFLNVVILRYNTGKSFITGRSVCFSCGRTLDWYEMIPLFSYLFLGGRCSVCKSKISAQYPIVEAITGFGFVGIFLKFGFVWSLPFYLAMFSLLIIMSVYDLKHMIIPNGIVYSFDILALIFLIVQYGSTLFSIGGADFLAGPILFAFFGFFWLVSRGTWMGLGDAKLALGIGWIAGLSGGIFAIMLAFWIGTIWSLGLMALEKLRLGHSGLSMKSEIPFAPFIILAFCIQFATSWNMVSFIHFLG